MVRGIVLAEDGLLPRGDGITEAIPALLSALIVFDTELVQESSRAGNTDTVVGFNE